MRNNPLAGPSTDQTAFLLAFLVPSPALSLDTAPPTPLIALLRRSFPSSQPFGLRSCPPHLTDTSLESRLWLLPFVALPKIHYLPPSPAPSLFRVSTSVQRSKPSFILPQIPSRVSPRTIEYLSLDLLTSASPLEADARTPGCHHINDARALRLSSIPFDQQPWPLSTNVSPTSTTRHWPKLTYQQPGRHSTLSQARNSCLLTDSSWSGPRQ